jgi:S1-C subfamily serine protease
MNALDIIIILMVLSSLFRGYDIGLIRQLFSTTGFISGLFLGAWLEHYTVRLVHSAISRSLVTIFTTLGMALLLLWLGELLGTYLKARLQQRARHINKVDGYFGSALGAATLLAAIWLAASVILAFPSSTIQSQVHGSQIILHLDRTLPAAPNVVASISRLIDPNGFPEVFTGDEPNQPENTVVPGISVALQQAINKDKASVVKVEGLGCGGIVDGSGFVIAPGIVATNAHVVAGVAHPYIKDTNGQHSAVAEWFDPSLDFAILRSQNLAGTPLSIDNSTVTNNTLAAILGYPGGGPLTAGGAQILDDFTAQGRDIYGNGVTERDVYSLAAKVIPGNSGGPLITADGRVIGIVFAESTAYQNVGYALSTPQILSAISQAEAQNQTVSTGSCAE